MCTTRTHRTWLLETHLQVYRGRWHSSDVAIKIIVVRTPEELPKVLKEAEVMLQLDHPNIVRAFHASVWNPSEQVRAFDKVGGSMCCDQAHWVGRCQQS